MKLDAPEMWLAIAEILIGLGFVSNGGLLYVVFGGPILAAGTYTYLSRARNYRNYRRVHAALGIFLLLFFTFLITPRVVLVQ